MYKKIICFLHENRTIEKDSYIYRKISNILSVSKIISMFGILSTNFIGGYGNPAWGLYVPFSRKFFIENNQTFFSSLEYNFIDRIFISFSYQSYAWVYVFIMLSGFGLTLSMVYKKKFHLPDFIWSRFSNLYVNYLLAVLISIFIMKCFFSFVTTIGSKQVFALFLCAADILPTAQSINDPFWFMSVIMLMYLFYPIIPLLYKYGNLIGVFFFCIIFNEFSSFLFFPFPWFKFMLFGSLILLILLKLFQYVSPKKIWVVFFVAFIFFSYDILDKIYFILLSQDTTTKLTLVNSYSLGFIFLFFSISVGGLIPGNRKMNSILLFLSRGTIAVFFFHYLSKSVFSILIMSSKFLLNNYVYSFMIWYFILLVTCSIYQKYINIILKKSLGLFNNIKL